MRSLSGASLAFVAMLTLCSFAVGCGQVNVIKARKAFKAANVSASIVNAQADPQLQRSQADDCLAGGDGDSVQLHVGQEVSHGQRVDEVWFSRMADLSPVLERGENVGLSQQLDIGVRAVGPDFLKQILEANHRKRCLNP